MLVLKRSSWDTDRSILQLDLDVVRQKVSWVEKFQAETFQQNDMNIIELWQLYKEATVQEHNQSCLDSYTGQDYHELWNFVCLLEEIGRLVCRHLLLLRLRLQNLRCHKENE